MILRYRKRKKPVVLMDPVIDQCNLCKMLLSGSWDKNPERVGMTLLLRLEKMENSLTDRVEHMNTVCLKLMGHLNRLSVQLRDKYMDFDPIINNELDGIKIQIRVIKDIFYRETV